MIQNILLTFIGCSFLFVLGYLIVYVRKNKQELKKQEDELLKITHDYRKVLSQKKSSEVLLGQVAEKIAPFTDVFPHDPRKASFLGNPIDYIVFDDDKIIFIEVKSGNSRLSDKQKKIKNLVLEKKIVWEEIKIKPDEVNEK